LPSEPVVVDGDEHAIHQVLANLLANAHTHTPPGTTVTTSLSRLDRGDEQDSFVRLSVVDDGPGIPAEIRDRAFDRFVHSGTSSAAGDTNAGLGLSIVAAISAAHGGSVTVQSEVGRTAFDIDLPVDGPPPEHTDVETNDSQRTEDDLTAEPSEIGY
jgi:two-component system, OmpR family, sensor kinase